MPDRSRHLLLFTAVIAAVTLGIRALPPPDPEVPQALAARAVYPTWQHPEPPPPPPPPPDVLYASVLSLPPDQQRAAWHRMIRERRNTSDACYYLVRVADESSVPVLIDLLREFPPAPDECCLGALEAITHERLGPSADAWERWWYYRPRRLPGPA